MPPRKKWSCNKVSWFFAEKFIKGVNCEPQSIPTGEYPHLEVSVLKLSEVQKDNESKRIDSEFFKKEYFDAMETIQLNQVEYLGDNMKFNSRYSQPIKKSFKLKEVSSKLLQEAKAKVESAIANGVTSK